MMLKKNAKIEVFVPEQNGCTRGLLKDNGEEEDQRRPTTRGLKNGKEEGLAISITYY
jgi:hypothetical protein